MDKEIVIVTYNHRNFYLPHEIIFNILSSLPVKPLLRFKSVCKSWRDLISSHQFIKYHLKRVNRPNNFIFQKHMCFKVSRSIPTTLSSESINFSTFERVTLDLPFEETFVDAQILASCDGLILIFRGGGLYCLWNPSTRACKPLLGLRRFKGEAPCFRLYGICYDVQNDSYKVISGARLLDSHTETTVVVYDCKTDLCTYITDFPYEIYMDSQGAHVNKTPHWLVYSKRSIIIIYFDSSEGIFKEVPKPTRACDCYELELRVFQEKLCLVYDSGINSYVMVMEEYGVKESWTTLFVIRMSLDVFDVRPLGLAESGEVVIESRQGRVDLYDHQMCDYTSTNLLSYYNDEFMAATFVESLVPPGGFD